ncbi:hypothetical protein GCM10023148_29200 [Actinokineospora soli]
MDGELIAGRYLVGEVLGSGGVAQVRRAWDTRLRRAVAVKTLRGTPDRVDQMRFEQEIQALTMLHHPGLVEVYDAGRDGERRFVVLRLVEGCTLRERIAEGPLGVAETVDLGARLADALAYVHEMGVTHRDVKPSNILIDADGTPYLADFGASRLHGSDQLTGTNEMIGTAAYLAPEQVRGTGVDPRADVYALGLVLLECLTGHAEYPGGGVESAVARLHRPPAIPDDLPADLVRLLSLMTALTPHRRPTARECAQTLSTAGFTRTQLIPWQQQVEDRPVRRHAIAAGLVAAAGLAAWIVASAEPPAPSAVTPPPVVIPTQTADQAQPPTSSTTPVVVAPVLEGTGAAVLATDRGKDDDHRGDATSGKSDNSGKSGKGKGKSGK